MTFLPVVALLLLPANTELLPERGVPNTRSFPSDFGGGSRRFWSGFAWREQANGREKIYGQLAKKSAAETGSIGKEIVYNNRTVVTPSFSSGAGGIVVMI